MPGTPTIETTCQKTATCTIGRRSQHGASTREARAKFAGETSRGALIKGDLGWDRLEEVEGIDRVVDATDTHRLWKAEGTEHLSAGQRTRQVPHADAWESWVPGSRRGGSGWKQLPACPPPEQLRGSSSHRPRLCTGDPRPLPLARAAAGRCVLLRPRVLMVRAH